MSSSGRRDDAATGYARLLLRRHQAAGGEWKALAEKASKKLGRNVSPSVFSQLAAEKQGIGGASAAQVAAAFDMNVKEFHVLAQDWFESSGAAEAMSKRHPQELETAIKAFLQLYSNSAEAKEAVHREAGYFKSSSTIPGRTSERWFELLQLRRREVLEEQSSAEIRRQNEERRLADNRQMLVDQGVSEEEIDDVLGTTPQPPSAKIAKISQKPPKLPTQRAVLPNKSGTRTNRSR